MKVPNIITLLIALLLLLTGSSVARQPVFKQYSVSDGLPDNTVYYAYQDSEGFMWFGTESGASRFDGLHFKNFSSNEGLANNEVFTISEDQNNRLWFLGQGPLPACLENDQFVPLQQSDELAAASQSALIYSSLEVSDEEILFGTKVGILKLNTANKTLQPFLINPDGGSVFFMWQDELRNSYALTSTGIIEVDSSSNFQYLEKFERTISFSKAAIDLNGVLYFTKADALYRYHPITGLKRLKDFKGNPLISISHIDGEFWLGTRDGIYLYEKEELGLKEKAVYLKGQSVTSVHKDVEGGYWFTTLHQGVFYASDLGISFYLDIDVCMDCNILSLAQQGDSLLWIGGHDGLLMKMENTTIESIPIQFSKKKSQINHVFFHGDKVWLGTNGPIVKYAEDSLTYFRPNTVKDVLFDHEGGVYFASSSNLWFFEWDAFVTKFRQIGRLEPADFKDHKVHNYKSNKIISDDKGKFWCGTNSGLYVIEGEKSSPFLHPKLPTNVAVVDICSYKSSVIVATAGYGLFFINEDSIFQLSDKDGLLSNFCSSLMLVDDKLLVSTTQGVAVVSLLDTVPVLHRTIDLGSLEINDLLIFQGQIYVATSKGLAVFPKELIDKKIPSPVLKFTGLYVNREPQSQIDKLPHHQNNFRFEFNGISFSSAHSLVYEYKLEGVQNEWTSSSAEAIEYFSIAPGNYTLYARVRLKDSQSFSEVIAIPFSIQPPFWSTWYFRFLMILTALGLIYSFFKIRILTYNRDVVRELIQLINNRMKKEPFILVKDIKDGSQARIPLQKIKWIESSRNYSTFHLPDKTVVTRASLKEINELLSDQKNNPCLRIHRSYIVNQREVDAWHSTFVKIGEQSIPVGVSYKTEFDYMVSTRKN